MLGRLGTGVFSKRAVLRTAVEALDARRDPGEVAGRGEGGAVGGRRSAEHPGEARRERAEALEADREADVGDRAVGRAQEGGGPLEAASEEVGVRRVAERPAELPAEMGAGETGGAGEVIDVERLEIASVGEILGPEEMAGGRKRGHPSSIAGRAPEARRRTGC